MRFFPLLGYIHVCIILVYIVIKEQLLLISCESASGNGNVCFLFGLGLNLQEVTGFLQLFQIIIVYTISI